ncbi:MAG: hypothetical protein CSA66_07300 [Proteobacteria bacterium]|nr:MAG: hypothetical protein CSA66_07300 [Pseudomonadota bacterium]
MAAWSDMDLAEAERDSVLTLALDLAHDEADVALAKRWLRQGPPDLDPYDIPREHRQLFLDTFVRVVQADGRIDPEESEALRLIRELVG